MAIEHWIDEIARVFEISNGQAGTLKSYRVYEKDEFPEGNLEIPCAITYSAECRTAASTGGPAKDLWHGVTEFHLFANESKANYPALMLYFARIRNAAAAHITLKDASGASTVDHFLLRLDLPSLQGPVILKYGNDDPHLGIICNWEVKDDVATDTGYTPAA